MNINELEKPLPIINESLKLALYISTSIGVLITLIYCGNIDYYPGGITAGDTIFFIAATLGFSFLYILIVFLLHATGVLISPILRAAQNPIIKFYCLFKKHTPSEQEKIPRINFRKLNINDSQTILIGFFGLILILILYFKNIDKALGLTACTITMAFIFGLWNTKTTIEENNPERTKIKNIGLISMALIAPLILNQSNLDIINQAMKMIGVRHENVIISLDKKYQDFLLKNGIKGEDGVYTNSQILFRGIGSNTVIKIGHLQLAIPTEKVIIGVPSQHSDN